MRVVQKRRDIHNLALIGFMGVGKSFISQLVAVPLRFRTIDTDAVIEAETHSRISEIFEQEGEARFRQYEADLVKRLESEREVVIATGGGIGANPDHLASLQSHALTVCLWASPEALWERVNKQNHRPLLQGPDGLKRIRTLLKERESVYRQADILISTELRPPREVANQVLHQFLAARREAAA